MSVCCDLEVDVNGEETFMVDKKIIASYSGRLRKLFGKSIGTKKNLKVIFHDFPGGAEGFELMLRFCYNNGGITVTPSNLSLLHCAVKFMDMRKSASKNENLLEQTDKLLEEINYWTWPGILTALKQCQDFLPAANSSGVLQRCLDALVARLALSSEASPCGSNFSPDSSGLRLSSDTRSTDSLKNSFTRATWWFEDLLPLKLNLVEMVTKAMVSQKLDHVIISKFLLFYQKSKSYTATTDEKCKILETVIYLLCSLDQRSVPYKSLFGMLHVALNLNIGKSSRSKLENMIGYRIDQATLDNLLVPSPYGSNYLYDVNLVLRFLKSFLCKGGSQVSLTLLKKVAILMDLYMAEVAPDPCLKSSKFLALAMALPSSARESHDEMYRSIDLYFEVHAGLSEEKKKTICCALNYEKLSAQACLNLSQNTKFPSKFAVRALISQQLKLKNLLHSTSNYNVHNDSRCSSTEAQNKGKKDESNEQIILYAGKPDLFADNERLRAHLQGMQCRVMELEKLCRKMQTQMGKIMKSKDASHSTTKSLPKLCS